MKGYCKRYENKEHIVFNRWHSNYNFANTDFEKTGIFKFFATLRNKSEGTELKGYLHNEEKMSYFL